MLKTLLTLTLGLFMFAMPVQAQTSKSGERLIILEETNTVVIRGPVTYTSVAQVQSKLLSLSAKLPKNAPIFLVLDTPGGSVSAGMSLIDTARGLPQKVVTITSFAASMGFVTAQMLDERVILPSGVMMSHRAAARVGGQIPGELNSRVDFLTRSIEALEVKLAERMGLDLKTYQKLILNEYWTYGTGGQAVTEGAADYVFNVRCSGSLQGTEEETIFTFFGPVTLTFSKCPLISAPLGFNFNDTELWRLPIEKQLEIQNQIKMPYLNKPEFLHNHVLKNNLGVFQ